MCPLEKGVRGIETGIIRCRAGVGGQGKPLRRWKATQRWHVRQQEAPPARTRPSALFFIGTLSQTLTLRAAFSSSTYLLSQIPGPGRSSDDDFLNHSTPPSLFKGHIRPLCAPDRMATASLFFGRHLMMPCYTFGRCFFACCCTCPFEALFRTGLFVLGLS